MARQRSGRNQQRFVTTLGRWLRISAVASVVALLAALVGPAGVARAVDSATLTLGKTVTETTVSPGQQFGYELTIGCSSITEGCVNATITDTLPAEFDVTSLPSSSSEREVTYDPNTRLLTIKFIIPWTLPTPNSGLPAGSTRKLSVGMRLPVETSVTDGQIIPNTAIADADNAASKEAAASITAVIPVVVRPVATKAWSPSTALAQSADPSTITLGVRNASSTSADVRKLRVIDDETATFNAFDVTALGPVTAYPPGTDRVVVGICTKPIGSPCTGGDWIEAEQSGPGPFPTPGATPLTSVTGVRFTFKNSADAKIPYSADGGSVGLGVQLRDTYRNSGQPIEPQSRLTVTDLAKPEAIDALGVSTFGQNVSAAFAILPNTVSVQA
ncbi:MAG: isopeptide-forming domain-containing fimbrial protein, partial [Actinomycetes bacterium]